MGWHNAIRRPPADWFLFAASFAALFLVRAALVLLPFSTVDSLLNRARSLPPVWFPSMSPDRSIWAVKAASRFVPGATCLPQALTLRTLLSLRGIESKIAFGVTKSGAGEPVGKRLRAHAWVESGGRVVLGETEAGSFAPLEVPRSRAL